MINSQRTKAEEHQYQQLKLFCLNAACVVMHLCFQNVGKPKKGGRGKSKAEDRKYGGSSENSSTMRNRWLCYLNYIVSECVCCQKTSLLTRFGWANFLWQWWRYSEALLLARSPPLHSSFFNPSFLHLRPAAASTEVSVCGTALLWDWQRGNRSCWIVKPAHSCQE